MARRRRRTKRYTPPRLDAETPTTLCGLPVRVMDELTEAERVRVREFDLAVTGNHFEWIPPLVPDDSAPRPQGVINVRPGAWVEVTKPMTEVEWLASDNPQRMLAYVMAGLATERQLRLFACAVARSLTTKWDHPIFIAIERYIDSDNWDEVICESPDDIAAIREDFERSAVDVARHNCYTFYSHDDVPYPNQGIIKAAILREIFGNPFIPICRDAQGRPADYYGGQYNTVRWLTPTVMALASAIYSDRAFDRLPILADALEEAGCTDQAILHHLRGEEPCIHCYNDGVDDPPMDHEKAYCSYCNRTGWMKMRGPHVRGCWVVDLLLGKE